MEKRDGLRGPDSFIGLTQYYMEAPINVKHPFA
jgi:hypothetical protein